MQLPSDLDSYSVDQLREMASRQQRQLEQQQQVLVAKEQRLRYLKQQELQQQQMVAENERLQQLQERVDSQESKLRQLRTVQNETLDKRKNNASLSSELEELRSLFNMKENELQAAARRAEELTNQLYRLRLKQNKANQPQMPTKPSATTELEKLKKELQERYNMNVSQRATLQDYTQFLLRKKADVATMDKKIAELKQRLHRKKQLKLERERKQQYAVTSKLPEPWRGQQSHKTRGGSVDNTNTSPADSPRTANKRDPKYQTLPYSIKFTPANGDDTRQEQVPGVAREVSVGEGQAVFGNHGNRGSSVTSASGPESPRQPPAKKSVNLLTSFGPKPYAGFPSGAPQSSPSNSSLNSNSQFDPIQNSASLHSQDISLSSTVNPNVNSPSFIDTETSTPVVAQPAGGKKVPPAVPKKPSAPQESTTPTGRGSFRREEAVSRAGPVSSSSTTVNQGATSSQSKAPGFVPPISRLAGQTSSSVQPGMKEATGKSNTNIGEKTEGTTAAAVDTKVSKSEPSVQAAGGKVPGPYHHTRLRAQPPPYEYHQRLAPQIQPGNAFSAPQNDAAKAAGASSEQGLQSQSDTKLSVRELAKPNRRYAPNSVIANTYMRKVKPEALDAYKKNMQELYSKDYSGSHAGASHDGRPPHGLVVDGESIDGPVVYNIDPELARLGHHGPRPLRRRLSSSSDTSLEIHRADAISLQVDHPPPPASAETKTESPHVDPSMSSQQPPPPQKVWSPPVEKSPEVSVSPEVINVDLTEHEESTEIISDSHIGPAHSYEESVTNFSEHNDSIPFADDDVSSVKESPVHERVTIKAKNELKRNRRVSFDPLALLLDAALEGEYDTVVKSAREVSDPSRPNDEGITALHNAICAGHLDIVRFLVEFGCDVNAPDNDGWTPLHCAASCNNLPMVQLLIEHGAVLYAATLSDQETALEKCEEEEPGFHGCFQYLNSIQEGLGVATEGVVYASFDLDAENEDELTVRINDKLKVVTKEDPIETEWWLCQKDGKQGYVPKNMIAAFPRLIPDRSNRSSSP